MMDGRNINIPDNRRGGHKKAALPQMALRQDATTKHNNKMRQPTGLLLFAMIAVFLKSNRETDAWCPKKIAATNSFRRF
jgi:hypothetical protein